MHRRGLRQLIQLRALCALTTTVVIAALAGGFAPPASAASCAGQPVPYPGDDATAAAYANWMANGARALGLPGEIPVMAGLVESGLRNLNYGDADSLGFFQMRTSIWNKGAYKGYPTNPDLQLKWFTDQATSVRAYYVSKGKGDPAASESTYGVWIADIERPAEQYRGRYQTRLAEAQTLIAKTCPGLQGINVTAPLSHLSIKKRQHPGKSGQIDVRVICPSAPCNANMRAVFKLPGRKKQIRLSSDVTMLQAGKRGTVRIELVRSMRKRIRNALSGGATTRARLRISVAGVNGAATVRVRKITLAR